MKKITKRLLALTLALSLTAGMLPDLSLMVHADEDEESIVAMASDDEAQVWEDEQTERFEEQSESEEENDDSSEEDNDQVPEQEEVQESEEPDEKDELKEEVLSEENADAEDLTNYPWDGMTDEEFAEWVKAKENREYIIALLYGENEEEYDSFLLRVEMINDQALWSDISEYLATITSFEENSGIAFLSEQDVNILLTYLNNKVGSTFSSNACQKFVRIAITDCYGVSSSAAACCASRAWNSFGVMIFR